MALVTPSEARHIKINPGNILTIGVLSLLWWGVATWTSNVVARMDIPVLTPIAVGAQSYLHAA